MSETELLRAMPRMLSDWEKSFEETIQRIPLQGRHKAGVLLTAIPGRADWSHYLSSARAEWEMRKTNLGQYPACLLLLYAGLAFHEYDEATFWPQFAEAVGSDPLSGGQQQEINGLFASAVERFGLELRSRGGGTDFVGSAIHHIGVPLSLWAGFLEICDWALWRGDWRSLSEEEWKEAIERRCGGRQRLRRFLIENRDQAMSFIQEMLDAREILTKDTSTAIDEIAQASILRLEYFDEVPETANFLRPQDPDSLLQHRAKLVWSEQHRRFNVQLPAVEQERLPAEWVIGSFSQAAAPAPDQISLNSEAFQDVLLLTLRSDECVATQELRGVRSWALFDMENGGRLVNVDRDELLLRSYTLVSRCEVQVVREGFDEDENPINEPLQLGDGNTCFITRLWPTGKYAELRIRDGTRAEKVIRFRARARIEARFFTGLGYRAAYFDRMSASTIRMDHLPILCVTIPNSYFRNNEAELTKCFRVRLDGKPTSGDWKRITIESGDREYYVWQWDHKPLVERKPSVTKITSLAQLGDAFRAPDLRGQRTLSVDAAPHIYARFDIEIMHRSKEDVDRCWKNLPGAYLPLYILSQSGDGMKWEDLLLARDVIAPRQQLSPYLLRKYVHHGILIQRGNRWFIRESRVTFEPIDREQCYMKYCGDPSILWGLYRRMYYCMRGARLPMIELVDRRGEIPYLESIWPFGLRSELNEYLRRRQVVSGPMLWIH